MVEIVDDVISILKADTDINALVGLRIYRIKAPSKPVFPLITVIESGNAEIDSADDEEYLDEVTIQTDIWSSGSFTAIKHAIQACMRKQGYRHSCGPDEYDPDIDILHKAMKFTKQIEV